MLVDRLEREHSYVWCIQLAHALGYKIGGENGSVWVDNPVSPFKFYYFQIDALIADLLRDARLVIARASEGE